MPSYKSFAVAGAGHIGIHIIRALLDKGVSVVVLARAARDVPEGATVAIVDYTDASALTTTLKTHNIDVVVSTLGHTALDAQTPLADAAKAAGVQLFIPSEFGSPTEGNTLPELAEKAKLAKHLAAIGLPYARIYSGWFTSLIPGGIGITGTGSVHVVGTGDMPISVTAEEDIAGFVAHIATTLAPAELANRSFRIEGDRATLREMAALFDKPVVVHDGPSADLLPIQQFILPLAATGAASNGWDWSAKKDMGNASADNALWPGHHWKTIKEYFNL